MHKVLWLFVLCACVPCEALAQVKSAGEIVDKLRPRAVSRGLRVEDAPAPRLDLTINFEFNSATLSADSQRQLDELGLALGDPAMLESRVRIVGHTDGVGSDAFNLDLSQRRANSVAYILSQNGVMPQRMYVEGFGERFPVATNATVPGRARNRRVEIQIMPVTS